MTGVILIDDKKPRFLRELFLKLFGRQGASICNNGHYAVLYVNGHKMMKNERREMRTLCKTLANQGVDTVVAEDEALGILEKNRMLLEENGVFIAQPNHIFSDQRYKIIERLSKKAAIAPKKTSIAIVDENLRYADYGFIVKCVSLAGTVSVYTGQRAGCDRMAEQIYEEYGAQVFFRDIYGDIGGGIHCDCAMVFECGGEVKVSCKKAFCFGGTVSDIRGGDAYSGITTPYYADLQKDMPLRTKSSKTLLLFNVLEDIDVAIDLC